MTEQYLTPEEVVERYHAAISERTLANWRSRGEGPDYMKVGGRVLYPLSALAQWETARMIRRPQPLASPPSPMRKAVAQIGALLWSLGLGHPELA
jgi:hypothetical protein